MPESDLGQYRLLQRLGAGGMGEVFLARLEREEGFAKLLVVKRILPELSESARFQEMFSAEARIAASLNHPQVVQVTDFGRIGKSCFLAMEYIEGSDLSALIEKVRSQKIDLSLAFILAVGLACLRALDYAHRRSPPVVHGDVSPSNVLVGREGEVKVSDFGLARVAGRAAPGESEIQGKLAYMAPEVARGRPPDMQSDLFGLGGILFELATSRPPREASLESARSRAIPPVTRLKPDVHPALARVIDRALAAEPTERYPNASEMEGDLSQIASTLGLDLGPRTVSATVAEILGDECRAGPAVEAFPRTLVALPKEASRRWSILATGIFVLIAGLAIYVLLGIDPSEPETGSADAKMTAIAPVEEPRPPEPDAGVDRPDQGARGVRKPAGRTSRRPKPAIDAGLPGPTGDPAPSDPDLVAQANPPAQGFSLRSESPLQVSLDGGPLKSTPLDVRQPISAAHVIRLQAESGFSATIRMETTEKPGRMRLAVRSKPFAVLYIDKNPKGLTPKGGIPLDRGSHRITLAPTGGKPMEFTLQLR